MFHKNHQEENEIEKIENEIEQLRPEEAKLARECDLLHGKAMMEDYVPEKHKIMAERAELHGKLSSIQNTIRNLEEKQALPKLAKLLKENIGIIKVVVNDSRIEVAENLDTVIPFDGCSHSLKLPVYEILRYQSTMDTNRKLLMQWGIIMQGGSTITKSILCPECLKEKKKRLEKGISIPSKRSGIAVIEITVFK